MMLNRHVPEDLLVHDLLYPLDLLTGHRLVMREVEAQLSGSTWSRAADVVPRTCRSAACRRCVPVWLAMGVGRRASRSTCARTRSPRP